jgi:hypothetical protein
MESMIVRRASGQNCCKKSRITAVHGWCGLEIIARHQSGHWFQAERVRQAGPSHGDCSADLNVVAAEPQPGRSPSASASEPCRELIGTDLARGRNARLATPFANSSISYGL